MKKKKRKIIKNKKSTKMMPEAMPEAAYNFSPDDVEIGDELRIADIKKIKKKKDH